MNTELINDSTNQEHLGNTINNDTLENIKQLLTTFRLDIKNYGREENTVKIIADNCTVSAPTWYKDTQGQGITIEGTNKTQQIIIKVINDGNLRLCFKGQDKRCNAQRIPVWIELGLQTINEETAVLINRGYTLDVFEDSVIKLRKHNIETIVHIINGLPYETETDMLDTVQYLNKFDIQGIKIHSLFILKGTPLEEYYYETNFKVLSLEEYVKLYFSSFK